ncbi:MAG: RelA/SpoT domain-containing protein [Desulfobulbaceae bacterium]|uniref:RelA/SpoT domain-containing protein n=1 Tax=Candidatus Desulfobia pelagia TaxID=2841692 RepID=A0A8J6NG46_9BACT|nr:RelA/SpoT domain-containing protein [Candidatus Desulfobia pelagia]
MEKLDDTTLRQYRALRDDFIFMVDNLVEKLYYRLFGAMISVHEITFRVKSEESFKAKVEKRDYKDNPIYEMEDVLGIRIVIYRKDELDKAVSLLRKELQVEEVIEYTRKKRPDMDYRSIHVIINPKSELVGFAADWLQNKENVDLSRIKLEVQIRTMVMHTWAALSSRVNYKGTKLTKSRRKKLERLTERFDDIDDEITGLYQAGKKEYNEFPIGDNELSRLLDYATGVQMKSRNYITIITNILARNQITRNEIFEILENGRQVRQELVRYRNDKIRKIANDEVGPNPNKVNEKVSSYGVIDQFDLAIAFLGIWRENLRRKHYIYDAEFYAMYHQ